MRGRPSLRAVAESKPTGLVQSNMANEEKTVSHHRAGLFGLLITLLLAAAVEAVHHTLSPIPTPNTIVLAAVVYTTFVGGAMYGFLACGILLAYCAWHYSPPGAPLQFSTEDSIRVASSTIVAPLIVIMVGLLKRRSEKINEAIRERSVLEAQLAERDRIQAVLEDSRAEHYNIFNAVPAMIWFKDTDGRILRANQLAAESIGRSIEEIVGRSTWELYPEHAAKYQRDDQGVIQSGKPELGIIERYETPDGSEHWVRTDKIPYRNDTGRIVGVIVFAVDITEQKMEHDSLRQAHDRLEGRIRERAEELSRLENRLTEEAASRLQAETALQLEEERLQTLIDNTNAVIFLKDIEGRYLLANRRYEEIFGMLHGSAIGRTDHEMFPPHLADAFRRNDEFVLTMKQSFEFEEIVPQLDGLHTYISLKFPLIDAIGQPTGVWGISTDITDRKLAEETLLVRLRYEEEIAAVSRTLLASVTTGEALREALRHLREASDACRVYVFENFEDPELGLCMRQTHEVCAEGVKPEISNPLLQRLPYAPPLARWKNELARGNPVKGLVETFPDVEKKVLQPQNILSILALPIWSAGQWYGFIGFDDTKNFRDWTDEDVRLLRTAAEMIGAFVARQRSEAELRRAKELAEAASEAKTRFLANVSHEVRTPIMAMLGAAEMVRRSDVEAHHGNIILRNGQLLLNLVNELLDVSRIESDKLSVQIADCPLPEILQDVAAIATPLHMNKPVDFAIHYETSIPRSIQSDRTRLTQAVINLVNNAIKYTREGRVDVRVAVDREGPEPRLTIRVEDTGRGIPPEHLEHIFEVFAQVGPHSGAALEGVGLGLPISKWIAEQLQGSLTAESTPGVGSVFTLRTATGPLDNVEWLEPQQVQELSNEPSNLSGLMQLPRIRGRVLLAEDADDARELIENAMIQSGATVVSAADGQAAVEAYLRAGEPFDLILLDIRMPRKDGLEVAADLREAGCRTAMIAMTASTTATERDRIMGAGFDDVWSKPISLQEIITRSAAYLEAAEAEGITPSSLTKSKISDRLRAVSQEFVLSLPGRLQELRSAFESGNLTGAHDTLHRLVGTAGICGYPGLSEQAARALQQLHQPDTSKAAAEITRLDEMAASLEVFPPEG